MYKVFRKKSLDRLSSPERLDQLIQIVRPKGWWWLGTQGILVSSVVAWSIFGRIPITVTGQGILVIPRDVVQEQSLANARLVSLKVQLGESVKKGQVLAILDQSDIEQKLQQERQKLADLLAQFQAENTVQAQQNQIDREQIEQQRQSLQEQKQQAILFADLLKNRNLASIKRQQQSSEVQIQQLQPLSQSLQRSLQSEQQLQQQGIIAVAQVLQTQQNYLQNLEKIASLNTQLSQLDVQKAQIEQQYQENLSKLQDLQTKLLGLNSKERSLALKQRQTQDNQQQQLRESQQTIARLEQSLKEQGQIVSTGTGKVLEINVVPGQVINAGQSILTLHLKHGSINLSQVGLAYFSIGDGKKIQPGMEMQITPDTVKREDYGGILATVKQVYTFPVTADTVGVITGSPDLGHKLTSNGRVIQVSAALHLNPDNFSGYAWSSGKGPKLRVLPNTTTTTLVTVDRRAPITFAMPLLRSITGLGN
ncbi:MAG: NHLP bacteriocin system secretion protein [Chroococcidiopsidaceae cyanobacterium CP_BM_ER_R8_30]|nr:NHLP bacteriocin system secretion protein [Chroococcidiopsidaceae cyanobacterium CP_BM_ER_R8_30]